MSRERLATTAPAATLPALLAAFAAIYLIWGSTYLGIKIAIETIPPLLMAGVRFSIAGLLVIAWMRLRHGIAWPSALHWRNAAIIGSLLLLTGNGLICIAQQRLPSGLAALLVATVPLWMTLLEWLVFRSTRPNWRTFVGLGIGLLGVLTLIDPRNLLGEPIHLASAAMVLIACLSWSIGSLYSRRASLPQSLMLASGMEMLCAGIGLIIAGSLRGEWSDVDLAAVSWRSTAAFAYLIIFGSLIGFSAYVWLLKRVSPAAVSTYAYVNPMVAVLLGWWLANEPVGLRTWLAAGLIIAAVVMITLRRGTPATARSVPLRKPESTIASPTRAAPPAAGRVCTVEN